ncbi:hypothetical protein [uncultured Williamsia sp.]|uniref:YveK family protein n=1 Tax=uncultured Williamsia sp. TaxID=259311 RepID=UPI00261F2447|nr:hypothetical protein [uncultured Williamsia sp.]
MSEILDLIRRRLVFIVVCGLIAAAVPAALATTSPDSYRATARLFVATAAQDVTAANQGNLAAQSRVRSYALLAMGPELLARAAQRSGVSISEGALAQRISVSTPPDTVLLDIAATAGTPQEAAALSDAVSQELVTLVSQAERPLRGGSPSLGLLILQPADAGISKVPRVVPTQLALFGVAGLVVGAVIAILVPGRFRLRRRNRGTATDTDITTRGDAADSHAVTPDPATGTSVPTVAAAPTGARDTPDSIGRDDPSSPTGVNGVAPDATEPSLREHGASFKGASPADADRHPNWTTFDTLDTSTRPGRPVPTNGLRREQVPPLARPRPTPPPPATDRPGWEDLTDPSGLLRPIEDSPRRHRRESGSWQFSPSSVEDDQNRAHRSVRHGDESP